MEPLQKYYRFDGDFYFVLFDNKFNFSALELRYIFGQWGNVIFVEKNGARSNYYYVKYKYEDEVKRCVMGLEGNSKIGLTQFSRSPMVLGEIIKEGRKKPKKRAVSFCHFIKPRRIWNHPQAEPSSSTNPPPVSEIRSKSGSESSEYPRTEDSSDNVLADVHQPRKQLQDEKTLPDRPSSLLTPQRRKVRRFKRQHNVKFSPDTKGTPPEEVRTSSPRKKTSPKHDDGLAAVHRPRRSLASTFSHVSPDSPSTDDLDFEDGSSPDVSATPDSDHLAAKDPLPDSKVIPDPSTTGSTESLEKDPSSKLSSDKATGAEISTNKSASSDTLYSASGSSLNPLSRREQVVPDPVVNDSEEQVGIPAIFYPATGKVVITQQPVSQMRIPPPTVYTETGEPVITSQPVSIITPPQPIVEIEQNNPIPDSDDSEPDEDPTNLKAECLVVFNFPKSWSKHSVLHLLENWDPACATPVRIINSSGLRYCIVYFKSFFHCITLERMYDDNIIVDDKILGIMRPESIFHALSVNRLAYT